MKCVIGELLQPPIVFAITVIILCKYIVFHNTQKRRHLIVNTLYSTGGALHRLL